MIGLRPVTTARRMSGGLITLQGLKQLFELCAATRNIFRPSL